MSKWMNGFMERSRDQLTVMFLQQPEYQLNKLDRRGVRLSEETLERVYGYKECHLVSYAMFSSRQLIPGVHIYSRRSHEFSLCAESLPIAWAQRLRRMGKLDELLSIVTLHGNHDKFGTRTGEPYIIPPCERCIRLLEQVAPDCLVIMNIDGAGRLVKVPLEACRFFQHPRKHNGE